METAPTSYGGPKAARLIFLLLMVFIAPLKAQYTLTDEDVVVTDGIITEYDTFNIEDIIGR